MLMSEGHGSARTPEERATPVDHGRAANQDRNRSNAGGQPQITELLLGLTNADQEKDNGIGYKRYVFPK
jgi:hypothetical protein